MNATVSNIFSRVLMLGFLLCGMGSSCSKSLDFASSEEEPESVQGVYLPANAESYSGSGRFFTRVPTVESVDLYFDYAAGRGLQATYQKPGMAFPQLVAGYPVLRDAAGNSQRWSTLTLEEARLLTRDRKWGVSGSGMLQDLGVRVRGGMQGDDSKFSTSQPSETNVSHEAEGSACPSSSLVISSMPVSDPTPSLQGPAAQQLLGLKRSLGNNYLGAETWQKLGVEVSDRDLPKVSDALLSSVCSLQKRGEQPLLMLDLGESIAYVEDLCEQQGITMLELGRDDEQFRSELIYSARPLTKSWMLVPGSDHGVLPGSRFKTFDDQVSYMASAYRGYEVGSVRELVTLSMLKYLQDGVVLFPREPLTYGRCVEQYGVGCWKGYRVGLGANKAGPGKLSGLVLNAFARVAFSRNGSRGLFGVGRFFSS